MLSREELRNLLIQPEISKKAALPRQLKLLTPTDVRLFEKPTSKIQPIWTPLERAKAPERILKAHQEWEIPTPDVMRGLKESFSNTANMFNWILESRQYEAEYVDPLTGKPLKRPPDYNLKKQTQKKQIRLAWAKAKPELEAALGRTSEAALGAGIAIIGLGAVSTIPSMWKYYTAKKIMERVPQNEIRTALARHFRPYSGAKRPPTIKDIAIKEWWESLDKVEQVEVMKTGQNIYYVPRAKGFILTSKTYPGQFYGPEVERLYLPGPGVSGRTSVGSYELVKGHPLGKPGFSQAEILEKQRYEQWLKDRKVFIAPTEEVEVTAIAPEVGAIPTTTEGLDVTKISTDQYLALKPMDMEDLYATYQEGFDKRAEPLKQRVETLGKEFEKAQPRSPERKKIKQEIEKAKKEIADIEGESTGRFFDAQLKLRDELEKRITDRYELTGDTEIYEILDDFFTRTSEPGYLERYWQTPQNEILQQVLGGFVEDGKLIPKTKAEIGKVIPTPPEVTKPPEEVPVEEPFGPSLKGISAKAKIGDYLLYGARIMTLDRFEGNKGILEDPFHEKGEYPIEVSQKELAELELSPPEYVRSEFKRVTGKVPTAVEKKLGELPRIRPPTKAPAEVTPEPGALEERISTLSEYWNLSRNEAIRLNAAYNVSKLCDIGEKLGAKSVTEQKALVEEALEEGAEEVAPVGLAEERESKITRQEAVESLTDSVIIGTDYVRKHLVETPTGFGGVSGEPEIVPANIVDNIIKFRKAKALPENQRRRDPTILKSVGLTEKDITHPAIEHDIHFSPEFFATGKLPGGISVGPLGKTGYWTEYGGGGRHNYYHVYEKQPNGDILCWDVSLIQNDFYVDDPTVAIPIVLGKKPPTAPPTEVPKPVVARPELKVTPKEEALAEIRTIMPRIKELSTHITASKSIGREIEPETYTELERLNDRVSELMPAAYPETAEKVRPEVITKAPISPKAKPMKLESVTKTAQKIIQKRPQIPVLGNILVENGNLIATDLETSYIAKIDKPDGMYKFIGKNLEKSELKREDFPDIVSQLPTIDIGKISSRQELITNLERALRTVSRDETRYVITSPLLKAEGGKGSIVSTDGRRLSASDIELKNFTDGEYIISNPKKVSSALGGISGEELTVKINKDKTSLSFEGDNGLVVNRLVEGKYPEYTKVFPKLNQQYIVNKGDLSSALKILKPYAQEADKAATPVNIKQKEGSLILTSGKKAIKIPVQIKPVSYMPTKGSVIMPLRLEEPGYNFNVNYLTDAVNSVKGAKVFIGLVKEKTTEPFHIYGEDLSKAKPTVTPTPGVAAPSEVKPTPPKELKKIPEVTPFTKEQVDAYNRYTHFPVDINKEYNKTISNINNNVQKVITNYGITKVPEGIKTAVENYKVALKEYYLRDSEIRSYAPPPSVVGPAKYPTHKIKKADRMRQVNTAKLEKAEKNLKIEFNKITKGKLPIETINKWLPTAQKVSKLKFGQLYAEEMKKEADVTTGYGQQVKSGMWDHVFRKRGRELYDKLVALPTRVEPKPPTPEILPNGGVRITEAEKIQLNKPDLPAEKALKIIPKFLQLVLARPVDTLNKVVAKTITIPASRQIIKVLNKVTPTFIKKWVVPQYGLPLEYISKVRKAGAEKALARMKAKEITNQLCPGEKFQRLRIRQLLRAGIIPKPPFESLVVGKWQPPKITEEDIIKSNLTFQPELAKRVAGAIQLSIEAGWKLVEAGLLGKQTFWKHYGQYLGTLYTSKELAFMEAKKPLFPIRKRLRLKLQELKQKGRKMIEWERRKWDRQIKRTKKLLRKVNIEQIKGIKGITSIRLKRVGYTLDRLMDASVEDLTRIKGISEEKAGNIIEVAKDLANQNKRFKNLLAHYQRMKDFAAERIGREGLPYEIRKKLGEILEPAYPWSKRYLQSIHDAVTAEVFNDVANVPEWCVDIEEAIPPDASFVQMVESKKLGPLSGKWVLESIADDINAAIRIPSLIESYYNNFLGLWKWGKVVPRLGTHARNIQMDFIFAYMAGLDPYRVDIFESALRDYIQKGPVRMRGVKQGWLETEYYQAEIRFSLETWGVTPGNIIDKVGAIMRKGAEKMGTLYAAEDQVFKMAIWKLYQEKGFKPEECDRMVDLFMPNYKNVPKITRVLRKSPVGAPFFSFTSEMARVFKNASIYSPVRLAIVLAIPTLLGVYSWKRLQKKGYKLGWKEYKQLKKQLPDYMRKGMHVILPIQDKYGRFAVVDLTYTLGWGDWIELGFAPLRLFSNPFSTFFVKMKTGIDPFSKRKIIKPEYNIFDKCKAWVNEIYRDMMPSIAPAIPFLTEGGYDWKRLSDSLRGKPDYNGRLTSPSTVALSAFAGIKINWVDLAFYPARDLVFEISGLDKRMRAIMRDARYTDPKTGQLNKKGQRYIRQLMEKRDKLLKDSGLTEKQMAVVLGEPTGAPVPRPTKEQEMWFRERLEGLRQ